MNTRHRRASTATIALVATAALVSGCSGSTDTEKAQSKLDARQAAVTEAQQAYDQARTDFCGQATDYVRSLDRYGKIFSDAAATVGDARTLGADLERPHDEVAASAQAAVTAHGELVEAQTALAKAQADAANPGGSSTASTSSTTSTTTLLPAATVERVEAEQRDLDAALKGISDDTTLTQAGIQANAAAFALEVAWLRVLADGGCLTDQQLAQANAMVAGYTAALQTALTALGVYSGEVDGIYGPETAQAVASFQTAHSLPPTGYVDAATAVALQSALVAQGGQAAVQSVATTAAVQSMLKLAGFWNGPIDGEWNQALTDAVVAFQTALGVPTTGVIDNATMDAARRGAVDEATTPETTAPSTSAPSTPTTPASTTSPSTTSP